jgi:lysophospholipase L1-like esterase
MSRDLSRRQFMTAAGAAAGLSLLPDAARAEPRRPPPEGRIVLFQGDSITDAGRNRKDAAANHGGALGTGYPLLVASGALKEHAAYPLEFYNRGISGNTVPDLQARWAEDALALKPDVLSILIGVNDYWHTLDGSYQGTVEDYERQYAQLLAETKRALPATRILVLEPFVLRTGAVSDSWFPEFDRRRAVAQRVAKAAEVQFVPLQEMFDEAARTGGPAHWLSDGVHPTPAGHAAIAERWRAAARI